MRGLKILAGFSASILVVTGIVLSNYSPALANAPLPPNPQSNSVGLEGTISGPPPAQPATITTPTNGQTFNSSPITVAGLCPSGMLIKVFTNNVFVGAAQCLNGSYTDKADLFLGDNQLVAVVYDALGQAGPNSNSPTVIFASQQFAAFTTLLSLTSSYAERGTKPGQELDWPITINGGTAPYALSIDWGDDSQQTLLSEQYAGVVTIKHTYQSAGTYNITIEATDKSGETAFLQLVGVATGQIAQGAAAANGSSNSGQTITKVAWWAVAPFIPLVAFTFWLGRRHEIYTLRKRLERVE